MNKQTLNSNVSKTCSLPANCRSHSAGSGTGLHSSPQAAERTLETPAGSGRCLGQETPTQRGTNQPASTKESDPNRLRAFSKENALGDFSNLHTSRLSPLRNDIVSESKASADQIIPPTSKPSPPGCAATQSLQKRSVTAETKSLQNPSVTGWWFAGLQNRLGYEDGRRAAMGVTHRFQGQPVMCRHGFHASKNILDAFQYSDSPIVWHVALGGTVVHGEDKIVATERTYLRGGHPVCYALRQFIRLCALDVIMRVRNLLTPEQYQHLRTYLKTGRIGMVPESKAIVEALYKSLNTANDSDSVVAGSPDPTTTDAGSVSEKHGTFRDLASKFGSAKERGDKGIERLSSILPRMSDAAPEPMAHEENLPPHLSLRGGESRRGILTSQIDSRSIKGIAPKRLPRHSVPRNDTVPPVAPVATGLEAPTQPEEHDHRILQTPSAVKCIDLAVSAWSSVLPYPQLKKKIQICLELHETLIDQPDRSIYQQNMNRRLERLVASRIPIHADDEISIGEKS